MEKITLMQESNEDLNDFYKRVFDLNNLYMTKFEEVSLSIYAKKRFFLFETYYCDFTIDKLIDTVQDSSNT